MNNAIKTRLYRLFSIALVISALSFFSGCCLIAHHRTDEPKQEKTVVSHLNEEDSERSESTSVEKTASVESAKHQHAGMSMRMHGERSWHWWMGGMMVVMMTLMIL